MKPKFKELLQTLEDIKTADQTELSYPELGEAIDLFPRFYEALNTSYKNIFNETHLKILYSNDPYGVIGFLGHMLNQWRMFVEWEKENEEVLQEAKSYAHDQFEAEIIELQSRLKAISSNAKKEEALQLKIKHLNDELGSYATEDEIKSLIQEKLQKEALLKDLKGMKGEIADGLYEKLDIEVVQLQETHGQKFEELEKLKKDKSRLLLDKDILEEKITQNLEYASELGNASSLLKKIYVDIMEFNQDIINKNNPKLNSLIIQIREDLLVSEHKRKESIHTQLKVMQTQVQEIERILKSSMMEPSNK